jgi:hypothetical protein
MTGGASFYAAHGDASARIFRAALLSRSCIAAQLGHCQSRIDRSFLPSWCPQVEPVWLLGSHRLITTTRLSYGLVAYGLVAYGLLQHDCCSTTAAATLHVIIL